jgi:predicted GNAT family acetyltransferase
MYTSGPPEGGPYNGLKAALTVAGLTAEDCVSEVVNNETARRFEMTVDGHTGFVKYARTGDRIELIHTEVPPELGGRGLGGVLAKAALDYAQQNGLKVIPTCPFVKKYLERHTEYAPLV